MLRRCIHLAGHPKLGLFQCLDCTLGDLNESYPTQGSAAPKYLPSATPLLSFSPVLMFMFSVLLAAMWVFTRIFLVFPFPWLYGPITLGLTCLTSLVVLITGSYMWLFRFPRVRQIHQLLDRAHSQSRLKLPCEQTDCLELATFGPPHRLSKVCALHKRVGMVQHACEFKKEVCELEALYGKPGKRLQFCDKHVLLASGLIRRTANPLFEV